jgi:hypothetical protein
LLLDVLSLDDGQAHNEGIVLDDSTIETLMLAEGFYDALDNQDDDVIELTDEVIFIGTPDGQIKIGGPIKCACCGGTTWHCTCPDFCFPECAICHNGNGNCTCWQDMGNCPFEGAYFNTEYPCSIRGMCDFFGRDFNDCETYKTRDPNSHNLQC